jgi:hypothetical protein
MNRKHLIIIGILLVIVIIEMCFIFGKKKDTDNDGDSFEPTSKFTITYSSGGGFGTELDCATENIEIDQGGNIKMYLPKYKEFEPLTFKISEKEAKELYSILMSKGYMKLKEDLSNYDVSDGGSSYITIKSDNVDRSVGGHAAFTNGKFSSMVSEIRKVVGEKNLDKFDEELERFKKNYRK